MKKKIINITPKLFALILAGISIILLLYYIIYPSRGEFHSDSTDTIMWAEAAINAKSIFNKNFHYAALLPFGGHLLMIPYIILFGVSMKAHILGMITFAILFIIGLILLCRTMKWGVVSTSFMVFNTILILSLSTKLREIFWGHIIYYSLGILFMIYGLVLIFHTINLIEKDGEKFKINNIIILTLSSLWFLLSSTNQLQALTIFALPTIGGLILMRFCDINEPLLTKRNIKYILYIVILLVSTLIGVKLGKNIMEGFRGGYADAFSAFSSPNDWVNNLHKFIPQWLSLLDVKIKDGELMSEKNSIINLIKIIFSFLLIIIPFIMIKSYNKLSSHLRVLFFTHWIMTLLIMIGYTFGRLSAANWRLSPIVATSTLLSVTYIRHLVLNKKLQRFGYSFVLLFLLVSILSANNILKLERNEQKYPLYGISAFLEKENLTYGYATFWNANSITVISDSKVKVRCIEVDNKGYRSRKYQTQDIWYKDQPNQENYFMLLSLAEYSTLKNRQADFVNSAITMKEYQDYVILVFNDNIFNE